MPSLFEEEVKDVFATAENESGGDDVSRQLVLVRLPQFNDQLLGGAVLFEILSIGDSKIMKDASLHPVVLAPTCNARESSDGNE